MTRKSDEIAIVLPKVQNLKKQKWQFSNKNGNIQSGRKNEVKE
jgi:hypothetical protein